VIFLSVEDLLHVAERAMGAPPELRDGGLLDSAAQRPRTTIFGEDAYPSLHDKAAALLHSLARNHALVDGNKRLALAATATFLWVNDWRLDMTNDDAYELIVAVADGTLDEIQPIARALRRGSVEAPR
jgi:death-on-curing protein